MTNKFIPLYDQQAHITQPLYDQQVHTTLCPVLTPLSDQQAHTTLVPTSSHTLQTSSHHSTTSELTPLYDQWTHTTLQPVSSHHSTTSELTPLYDHWTHTTLWPLNSHHSTTSELTPLCNTVNLRLHATYPHIHSIHKSRRIRHWTWEGDHCGLDHQWSHQYNEGKDRPESCLPPDSSTSCGLGAPGHGQDMSPIWLPFSSFSYQQLRRCTPLDHGWLLWGPAATQPTS